ncbi:MAG: proline--tRNA ligase [Candidatus Aenigmarchaeota archaeon]|nr:proline--tRNA ligase [Candidatus Aenigmarchaeota archaeon]MDI6722323.1 proline--tRNA ligase [Candidatus Aenigmarchaeota archaeon]
MEDKNILGITTGKEDFSEWYSEVVSKAGIIDQRYPVKGFPVYMPWGMFLIKQVFSMLEDGLHKTGHEPVNFPVVIPEANLSKEKEHVKGFEKEVFWVTHAGDNELEERLFLRPTSETAMYPMYSLWIRSYMDLPLKLYQSVQVYRYETKMTKPLMRGREFFWIETHTAQRSEEDVEKQIEEDMKITKEVLDKIGIPFMLFESPSWDKFPGAEHTYAYDTLIPDGRSLQVATTHNLGQKFAKAFDIKFVNEKQEEVYAYQTCFGPGVSRIVSAIISVHGDDKGLVLPPDVSPVQIAIVPVPIKGKETEVSKKCESLMKKLRHYRIRCDNRVHRPGFKFNEWEMKGVPLRIEIGPRDVERNEATLVRRDSGEKYVIPDDDLESKIKELVDDIFSNMKFMAEKRFLSFVNDAKSFSEMESIISGQGGFVRVPFCSAEKDGEECAAKIDEIHAKVRGTIFGRKDNFQGKECIVCGKHARHMVYVAKAY